MADFVKQHYVPKFYLKNFCQPDGTVYCYDKLRDKSFKSNVSNIAHENFFYDIPELARATVESSMAIKDRIFSKVLKYIIQRKSIEGIRPETREIFFLFVATQMLRTNEFRSEVTPENIHCGRFREAITFAYALGPWCYILPC